jgi:hypothetical protein
LVIREQKWMKTTRQGTEEGLPERARWTSSTTGTAGVWSWRSSKSQNGEGGVIQDEEQGGEVENSSDVSKGHASPPSPGAEEGEGSRSMLTFFQQLKRRECGVVNSSEGEGGEGKRGVAGIRYYSNTTMTLSTTHHHIVF